VEVVVCPVSLLLLHADVCGVVVVVMNGVPCALSFGELSAVVVPQSLTLSAVAAVGVSASATTTSAAPIILRDFMMRTSPRGPKQGRHAGASSMGHR
jgi:hypothetical protein